MSSTVRVVQVIDLKAFADNMLKLRTDWIQMRQALHLAMLNTVDPHIQRRIPQSSHKRYPYRVDAGNQTLKKSYHLKVTKNSGTEIKIFLGSEGVSYARYVNDMPDPLPNGRRVNWTRRGSGNHFFLVPLEEHGEEVPKDFCEEIDARLRRMGL